MKYRSKEPKPATGMEMSVTFSLPAEADLQAHSSALVKFMGVVRDAANQVGATWVRIHCSGVPAELEDALQAVFDKANKRPGLRLVVHNPKS